MLIRKLFRFTNELIDHLRCGSSFFALFSLLCVVTSELLSHFSEKTVFQSLKFCETQNFGLTAGFAFNEIKDVALFIFGNFRLSDVFKNFAKGITQGWEV
jgi:hypothetical protein